MDAIEYIDVIKCDGEENKSRTLYKGSNMMLTLYPDLIKEFNVDVESKIFSNAGLAKQFGHGNAMFRKLSYHDGILDLRVFNAVEFEQLDCQCTEFRLGDDTH